MSPKIFHKLSGFFVSRPSGVVLFSLALLSSTALAAKKPFPPQPVIVAPVIQQQIADRSEALGTTRANESITITSNVSEKIRAIYFQDGQKVEKGSLLAVLEKSEEEANLKQAEAVLGERQLALQRLERLEKRKLAATDELDRARLAVQQAKASIAAIKARIRDREIRSPFTGVIGLRNISVGALVEAGDVIATLDDIRKIKVDFTVPAVFLSGLKPGLRIEASATALDNKVFHGKIDSLDSRVDPVTRSIMVRAIIPNPEGVLLPGLQMQVDLFRNPRTSLLIPEAALVQQGEKHFVMLVQHGKPPGVLKREVKIGLRVVGKVEILDGLKPGDQVVTHGALKLKPGRKIRILAVDDGTVKIEDILKAKATIKGLKP